MLAHWWTPRDSWLTTWGPLADPLALVAHCWPIGYPWLIPWWALADLLVALGWLYSDHLLCHNHILWTICARIRIPTDPCWIFLTVTYRYNWKKYLKQKTDQLLLSVLINTYIPSYDQPGISRRSAKADHQWPAKSLTGLPEVATGSLVYCHTHTTFYKYQ